LPTVIGFSPSRSIPSKYAQAFGDVALTQPIDGTASGGGQLGQAIFPGESNGPRAILPDVGH
jgi:hypothetical protein